jgi:hypothetical protein
MMRYCPKSNGAPMAQTNLRYHWNFPRAGDSAKERAITPIADRAFYRARIALHSLCATSAPPSATLGSAPLSPRTLPNQAARPNSQLHRRPTRAEPQVWQREERAITKKPERGVWSVRHRPPCFPCAAGDSAEPLDSLEASAWCSEPGSDRTHQRPSYRVGTIGGHPLLRSSPRLLVFSLDRRKATVQSHGGGLSRRLMPPLPLRRPQSGRAVLLIIRAVDWAGPADHPLAKSPAGPGRVNWRRPRSLVTLARTIFLRYPPAELRFFAKQFREKPSAASIPAEINRGDVCRAIGAAACIRDTSGLAPEISLEISKCIE